MERVLLRGLPEEVLQATRVGVLHLIQGVPFVQLQQLIRSGDPTQLRTTQNAIRNTSDMATLSRAVPTLCVG